MAQERRAAERKKQITDCLSYLFLIFLTGCLVGWVYEEIFYWIIEGLLHNLGILYSSWLPIYGIGSLGMYAMKPVKKHPVLRDAALGLPIGMLLMFCNLLTGLFTVFAIVMLHLQILQEERYLTAAFGRAYLDYRHRVFCYLGRRKG